MDPEETTTRAVQNLALETTRNKWRLHANEVGAQVDETGRTVQELVKSAPIPEPKAPKALLLNQKFINGRKAAQQRYEAVTLATRKRFEAFQRGRYQQMKYNGRWIDYTAPLQIFQPITRRQ